jgi:hypothetical protein
LRFGRANLTFPPGPYAVLQRDAQTPYDRLKARIKWLLGLPPYSGLGVLAKKIRRLANENGQPHACRLMPDQRRAILDYWRRFGVKPNLAWHSLYLSVCPDRRAAWYIPEDLYYTYIEPTLNRIELARAYEDKNAYDRLFCGVRLPFVVLRRINGRYYDSAYRPLFNDEPETLLRTTKQCCFIKPSLDSWGGRDVQRLVIVAGTIHLAGVPVTFAELQGRYGEDFVIQEAITQHALLAAFHPQSVNTIRVFTLRIADSIVMTSAVLRMGANGAAVDNQTFGGISCGISAEGSLHDYAIDKPLRKYTSHPTSGKRFADAEVPTWSAIPRLACQLHQQLPHFDTASWDFTVTDDEAPMLIEVNLSGQGINLHQGNNGPLFGEHTNAVLTRVFREAHAVARS